MPENVKFEALAIRQGFARYVLPCNSSSAAKSRRLVSVYLHVKPLPAPERGRSCLEPGVGQSFHLSPRIATKVGHEAQQQAFIWL